MEHLHTRVFKEISLACSSACLLMQYSAPNPPEIAGSQCHKCALQQGTATVPFALQRHHPLLLKRIPPEKSPPVQSVGLHDHCPTDCTGVGTRRASAGGHRVFISIPNSMGDRAESQTKTRRTKLLLKQTGRCQELRV